MEVFVEVNVQSSDADTSTGVARITVPFATIQRTFGFTIARAFQKDVTITITKDGRPFVEVKDSAIQETITRMGAAERVLLFTLIRPIMDTLRSDRSRTGTHKREIKEGPTWDCLRLACA